MKAEEIRGKTEDELKDLLLDLKKKQFNLRFQHSQGQMADTAQIRAVRRDIARVKTHLNAEQDTGKPAAKAESKTKKATAAKKSGTKAKATKKAETKSKPKKAESKKTTKKTTAKKSSTAKKASSKKSGDKK